MTEFHRHTSSSGQRSPHLEDPHPVAGLRLQGGGEAVAAGDGRGARVGLRDVDEQHLGEGVRGGVGGRRAVHADLGSASVNTV